MEYNNNEFHIKQVALPTVQITGRRSQEQFPVLKSASRSSYENQGEKAGKPI
jgi:hypothetical protein